MEKPDFRRIDDGIVTSSMTQHRVTEARSYANPHGAFFTDWRTACGREGTSSGAAAGTKHGQITLENTTTPDGLLSNGRYHRWRRAACKECTALGLMW